MMEVEEVVVEEEVEVKVEVVVGIIIGRSSLKYSVVLPAVKYWMYNTNTNTIPT